MERFEKPEIGKTLTVRTRSGYAGESAANVPKSHTMSGKVVSGEHWDEPASFRLYTGNKWHPISVIELKNILDLQYDDGTEGATEQVSKVDHRMWEMPNAKKDGHYVIIVKGDTWHCECKGWGFRKNCRHVTAAKAEIEEERKNG